MRVLFIKGPVLALQGLRDPRQSVDVDVWVDPSQASALLGKLRALGWTTHGEFGVPAMLVRHSVVATHPTWPCEVDVHNRFPGFFQEPQRLFDTLWARHEFVVLAGSTISCPGRLDHALIAGLHYLRDPLDVGQASKLDAMTQRLDLELTAGDRVQLGRNAAELGAADTALPMTSALGAASDGVGSTARLALAAWDLRGRPQEPATAWLLALLRAPIGQWPGLVRHILIPPEREITAAVPANQLETGTSSTIFRLRRLIRGTMALPRAVLGLVRQMRRKP